MPAGRSTGVFLESVGDVVTRSAVASVRWIPAVLLHGLVSVIATYPLVTRLQSAFALSRLDESDAVTRNFFVWRWQADRLSHSYADYWDAPLHFGATEPFALLDTQPLSGALFAMVQGFTSEPVLSFNLVVLLLLTLNGVAFSALARALRVEWRPAFALGVIGQVSPIALAQLGDPTLLVSFPLVFGVAAVGRFCASGEARWAVAVGICLLMAYGTSGPLLVAASIALPLLAVSLSVGPRWGTTLGTLLPTLVATGLVMAYPISKQLEVLDASTPRSSLGTASLGSWLEVAEGSVLERTGALDPAPDRFIVYPGLGLIALAIAGGVLGWRSHRRWVLGATLCGLLGFAATLEAFDSLLSSVEPFHPGLALLRHREVFATVAHAMALGLAAVSFVRLEAPRFHRARRLAWLGLLLGLVEGPALPCRLALPPSVAAQPWMAELPEGRDAPLAVVGPDGLGPGWGDAHQALLHRRPLLGGATDYVPLTTQLLHGRLAEFPTADGVRHLRSRGARALLVSREWLTPERAALLDGAVGTEQVFEDEAVRLYALSPATVDERARDANGPEVEKDARRGSSRRRGKRRRRPQSSP